MLEQETSKTLIELIIAILKKKNEAMKINFEALCEQPPLNLNIYLIKLLSNLLFDSESVQNDKFYAEKNIRLCASLVLSLAKVELKPLLLRDLGSFKQCDCSDDIIISEIGICMGCNSDNYESVYVKQEIKKIRTSENAKVMLYLLKILSFLQKGKAERIIDLMEKIF